MFQFVAVAFWLVNSVTASLLQRHPSPATVSSWKVFGNSLANVPVDLDLPDPFRSQKPGEGPPCTCDGFSLLSKTGGGANPCGCNFMVKTPRRELTAMSNGQLVKMASGLQEEVDKLQSTYDSSLQSNGEKLADLEKKLAEIKDQKKKKAGDEESATKARTKSIDAVQSTIDDDLAKIADIAEDVKMNQELVESARTSIQLRMQDILACGCEKLKEDGEKAAEGGEKASLVTKHARPSFRKDGLDYNLVYKIEKLERSKAKLNKKITQEQTKFGWKSRDLMKRIDEQKIKIDVAGNSNDKYKELNEDRLESVIAQKENTKRVLQRKTAQLKQVEKDAAEAQKQTDNLEAEMQQCGCKAPSDTDLEMRKFKLNKL